MKTLKWLFILVGLILLNLIILECLLRIGGLFTYFSGTRLEKELKSAEVIYDFSQNMKSKLDELGLADKYELDSYKKLNRVSYAATEAYNPYPPILHRFDSAYVVYTKDFELKQITVLSGESDATPSLLVEKARGEQTGYGDHFVTYIFYQNNLTGNTFYDRVDWYSWRGGSYDGFEEFWLFPMTFAEIILLIIWTFVRIR